jgi:hypothetical protein
MKSREHALIPIATSDTIAVRIATFRIKRGSCKRFPEAVATFRDRYGKRDARLRHPGPAPEGAGGEGAWRGCNYHS